jgi:hypothetical protein
MEGCREDCGHPEKDITKEPDNVTITWNASKSLPYSLVNTTFSAQMSSY